MTREDELIRQIATTEKGGAPKYHQKNAEQHKLFARERLTRLLDPGSLIEDGLLANAVDPELPADGVITGVGTIAGRSPVIFPPTVW